MTPILMHSTEVSSDVRDALRAASESEPEVRAGLLEQAARILARESELECSDVRELVGLPPGSCG
jgi:hypothetical protein